jgi:hypothetical protein
MFEALNIKRYSQQSIKYNTMFKFAVTYISKRMFLSLSVSGTAWKFGTTATNDSKLR